ncbi:hypothetical protein LDENG_00045320 [Lucifuga dentata]|nr:hypothetical protein LDENG_00045320 [Lucifuga dentata]
MLHIFERKDPPLPPSCLRLLVPPLRLVSAAVWKTIQHKNTADYGLLDDFVTAVTEIVPELLNRRQRTLLSLGLRAQVILDLCHSEQTIHTEAIQPHLDIMQRLTSLWSTETSDTEDKSSASDIIGYIQALIKDEEERQRFFQDVFPVKFGLKYSEDIQILVETFLLRLDKLLIVPNLKQVACMISDVPSVLTECVESFSHSQELKSLLEYQKDLNRINENDNPKVGTNICSALCLPVIEKEETVLEVNMFTDYMDRFNRELTVETAASRKSSEETNLESEERQKKRETDFSSVNDQSFVNSDEGIQDIHDAEALRGGKMGLDCCAGEVQVAYNVKIPAEERDAAEDELSDGGVTSAMDAERVQLLAGTTDDGDYQESDPTKIEKCTKEESKEVSIDTDEQIENTSVSNVMTSPELYTHEVQVLRFEPVVIASPRLVRQRRSLKMTKNLSSSINKGSKTSRRGQTSDKTCPTCGKTYSRAADMRRHQRTHTGEQPYRCSRCNKPFHFQHDLKRHELNVCRINVPHLRKNVGDPRSQLVGQSLEKCIHLTGHAEPVSSCDATSHSAQEKEGVNQKREGAPSPAIRQDLQPFSSTVLVKNEINNAAKPKEENVSQQQESQVLRKSLKSTNSHGKRKTNDNLPRCAECNRSFPDLTRLKTHNLRHKPCTCTKCDQSFKGFVDLSQHYVEAHDFRGPFPCTFCERSYTDLKGLIRHERLHTGDLPFQCTKCPKAFGFASALTLHDRTHTKEVPFLCWDCGKCYKSNAALRIHRLRCHSNAEEKRFCCEHCGKAYALKRSLDLHVAKLHAGVRHPCSHCGKLFRSLFIGCFASRCAEVSHSNDTQRVRLSLPSLLHLPQFSSYIHSALQETEPPLVLPSLQIQSCETARQEMALNTNSKRRRRLP